MSSARSARSATDPRTYNADVVFTRLLTPSGEATEFHVVVQAPAGSLAAGLLKVAAVATALVLLGPAAASRIIHAG